MASVWTFPKVWWLRVVDAMMKRCVSSLDRLDPGFGLWFMGGCGGYGVNL